MRIKDVAALSGTTARAVRHYHAIGLLPVPPTRGGYRDYDITHVARVSRIRWLAESGLTLAQVGAVLAEDGRTGSARRVAAGELRASLDLVEQRIAELAVQRDRLGALLSATEQGESLSPLPPMVAAYYDRLDELAADESLRAAVRREREFLELAVLRGEAPAGLELLFALDPDEQRATLEAFGSTLAADLTDDEVEALAEANVERLVARLGDRRERFLRTVDAGVVRRLYALFEVTGGPRERRIGAAMQRRLLERIEAEHA